MEDEPDARDRLAVVEGKGDRDTDVDIDMLLDTWADRDDDTWAEGEAGGTQNIKSVASKL